MCHPAGIGLVVGTELMLILCYCLATLLCFVKCALCLCAASLFSKQKSTECILLTVQEVGGAVWLAEFGWVLLVLFPSLCVYVNQPGCALAHAPHTARTRLWGKHKCQVFTQIRQRRL